MKHMICFPLIKILATFLSIACLFGSCSFKTNRLPQQQFPAAKYHTGYPPGNSSDALENVFLSVKRITNYTSYRTYIFDEEAHITLRDLNSENLLQRTRAGIVTNDATAGTALIIFSDGRRAAMLTCAHAVKAPDTIIQWNEYRDLDNNRYIQSISLKIKQQLYIREMPEGSKYEILLADSKNDIALIGAIYTEPGNKIKVFPYPSGNSSELKWGSFIYLAGYPTGQQMVSHGIVSILPEKAGYFLTDAPFNEGMSGGIALATTEAGGTFELVGMARSVAGTYSYILKPEKENHEFTYNPTIPYTDNVYVNQKKEINQGVTSVVSINQIRQLYNEKRAGIIDAGYNLDDFFGLNPKLK